MIKELLFFLDAIKVQIVQMMLKSVADLLLFDCDDSNWDADLDVNVQSPVTDLLKVHRHFGRVHRPVQCHRSCIFSLYVSSILSLYHRPVQCHRSLIFSLYVSSISSKAPCASLPVSSLYLLSITPVQRHRSSIFSLYVSALYHRPVQCHCSSLYISPLYPLVQCASLPRGVFSILSYL